MSNVSALLAGRNDPVSDYIYLERSTRPELRIEEHLRAAMARLPRLSPRRRRRRFVEQASALEAELQQLDQATLVQRFRRACLQTRQHGFSEDLLVQAFAAVREAGARTVGMRHFDVQLLGGWAMLQGRVAEIATGEGKTLTASLSAAVAAAAGAAVHVVTVNDYLAARDAELLAPLYHYLGLSVGAIGQDMAPAERREQYARDIVYVSNKELVFDYLKDRLAAGGTAAGQARLRQLYLPGRQPALLLRGLHLAIVDEADSVLIDEAKTPLIISDISGEDQGAALYHTAVDLARRMVPGQHFELRQGQEVWLKPAAEAALGQWTAGMTGLWSSALWRRELVTKALVALHAFHRDRHYIVMDGKVQIVDEFTGRSMPDRTWEQGLHQMVECKEGVDITGERRTLARITYQSFFRRYLMLCGMTGTALEVAAELRRVYDLDVVRIPPNKPNRRRRLGDTCWHTQAQRWEAVAERAVQLSRERRAVLIGTRSVEASERLGALLAERGVEHTVLNARQDRDEAQTVAQAGQPGRITVATNMAGRGTDIRPPPEVLESGGLHVILTEYHESRRIDRQLFGRSARQGEPGTVQSMVSLEDELFRRHSPRLASLALRLSRSGGTVPRWLVRLLVRGMQSAAERQNRATRMLTLRQEKKQQEMLGFAGRDR